MTTHRIVGYGTAGFLRQETLSLVLGSATTHFSYTVLAHSAGSLPRVQLSFPDLFGMTNQIGVDLSEKDTWLGQVVWGANGEFSTTVLMFGNATLGVQDYIFALSGDPLPPIAADGSCVFCDTASGFSPVTSGVFVPDTPIALDAITGVTTSGNMTLTGTLADEALFGAAGDDIITAGQGADTVDGGGGNDTLHGEDGHDFLFGAAGDDTLNGGAGTDALYGGGGHDRLEGGFGGDTLEGGRGDDTYILTGGAEDTLVEAANAGTDLIETTASRLTLPDHFENATYLGTGSFRVEGNDMNNLLTGGARADGLIGAAGDDTLYGDDGADTLSAGDGDDFVFSGHTTSDGGDSVFGGAGIDALYGGYGNDKMWGGAGDDIVTGGYGGDTLIGQDGNDTLQGQAWGDNLLGNSGDDFLNGGFGADRLNGGGGADKFFHGGSFAHRGDWIGDYDASEGDLLVFANSAARASDFRVQLTHATAGTGARVGDTEVQEAFVIYTPTGQIMWALVDGEAQAEINVQIGGVVYDLM